MSTTSATPSEILRHTSAFVSATLSRPNHRRRLVSILLSRLPPDANPQTLTLAASAVDTAAGANSTPAARSSALRRAERLLLSVPESALASLLLSLSHGLCRRPLEAARRLLDVFRLDPASARSEVGPAVFEELFLAQLLPLLHGFNYQRSKILSAVADSDEDCSLDDDVSVAIPKSLSKMSDGQAAELRELEREYEEALDENTRVLAMCLKEVLEGREDDVYDDQRMMIEFPPSIVENNVDRGKVKVFDYEISSDEEEEEEDRLSTGIGDDQMDFGVSMNGRYINPIWTEQEHSIESFNTNSESSQPKPMPFHPRRVSPETFLGQKSGWILTTKSPISPNLNTDSEPETSLDGISSCSPTESEAETEEHNRNMALFEHRQRQSKKQEQPFYAESSRSMPPKDFVCPITSNLFNDPVTLETGQTYERKAIQEWFDRGNSTCPITRQRLHSTHLPKTNYVLKRLIASWQDQSSEISCQNESLRIEEDLLSKPDMPSLTSPNSVIVEGTITELRLVISSLCTSEILEESEAAVLRIERFWQGSNAEEEEIRAMLSKPAVINGFVEILFNSVDAKVLRPTIFLLSELGSRDRAVVQTLTQVDSDVEGVAVLLKKGLVEAVVLIYQLRNSIELVELDLVDSLLDLIKSKELDLIKMCVKPKTAAVILLGQVLESGKEGFVSSVVRTVVAEKAVEGLVESLGSESTEEQISAVRILTKCMQEEGKCRHGIADGAKLAPVLESFVGASQEERFEIVNFLSELVKLNRRIFNQQILHIIKEEGSLSTMHTLLVYLQTARIDQCPVIAGLLLQLDLLTEPRKMSIFREEAIDSLITCLRSKDFPTAQVAAAETIVSLQGRFTISGKTLTRASLLKRAGFDKRYDNLARIDQLSSLSGEDKDSLEEERAAENWERKMALVLAGHEFGLLFEALSEGLKSSNAELASACLVAATWLVDMLKVLPETGVRGAARVCLLQRFISIFKSSKNTEDQALSLLALSSFIKDSEGMSQLASSLKNILKGLRELKKSTPLAIEMLKVFFEGQDSSAEMWNHKQLVEVDCSESGEVLSVVFFKDKIFSGHSDGTIKAWTGKGSVLHLIQEVREHTKAVTSLAVLPSGERLYSGSLDRTTRVWSVFDEAIDCIQVHDVKDQVQSLVVSNKISCFIPHGNGIKIHSSKGVSKLMNSSKYVKSLALEQGRLYCGCQDNSIQEIDLATETISSIQSGSRKLLGKSSPILALQALGGLLYAASPSLDGTSVKILRTSDYTVVGTLPSTMEVRTVAISSELVYLGCKKGVVEIWSREKQNKIDTLQTGTNCKVLCLALDSNEEVLVVGTSDGKIQAWGLS